MVTQSPQKSREEFATNGLSSDRAEALLMVTAENRIIGVIRHFKPYRNFSGREIGYHVFDPAARNNGHASEAVGLLIDHLFSSVPINRLQARVNPANLPSARIVMEFGFVREGRSRESVFVDGRDVDHDSYGLLRREWAERRPA